MQQIDTKNLAQHEENNRVELQEILRLHRDCSARFGSQVLRLLMANGDDKKNIALSPARLQAVMVLLANWTTPEIRYDSLLGSYKQYRVAGFDRL